MLPAVELAVDFAEWDRFVSASPDSTFCHHSGWRSIMRDVLGHDCLYMVAREESGDVGGILPLVRVKSPLGHYLVSMPFVNDGGPLGNDIAKSSLINAALVEAESSGAQLLELRSRARVESPLKLSFRKVAVHLPLPTSPEDLWERTFKSKLRSQIRRAAKENMVVQNGPDELNSFYSVFARNMRDLGTPVLPRGFFQELLNVFNDRVMFVSVTSHSGVPVAAACCLIWHDELEVSWASSLREYNHLSPNMLLYATTMELAIARKVKVFNFGRSTPGAATHKFKLQWGGADVPLPWAYWSRTGDAGTPSAEKPAFKMAVAAWQRLPVSVANRLGPLVSRCFP